MSLSWRLTGGEKGEELPGTNYVGWRKKNGRNAHVSSDVAWLYARSEHLGACEGV
jgi:hypothetical protein